MLKLQGSYTAMVTPFRDGHIDEAGIRTMVEFQIESGTSGLVPCGTTGESPTLSHEEHHRVIEIVIDQARSRVPVIAGTGSNNTAEAISLTEHALKSGRRRRAADHPILQSAFTGGAHTALHHHRGNLRHPDHHLQLPRSHRGQYHRRYHR